MVMNTVDEKRQLRRQMRARRRALSETEQGQAAEKLCVQLLRLPGIHGGRRFGAYFASDGEIDPLPALEFLIARGRIGYLPVLFGTQRPRVRFARYFPDEPLQAGRFDIPVPFHDRRALVDPVNLDWLLMPLVAFDEGGNRLGMGGGFYDASLVARRHRRHWRRPLLIGLAHEFQRVTRLEVDSWDIPLDGILTENGFLPVQRGTAN